MGFEIRENENLNDLAEEVIKKIRYERLKISLKSVENVYLDVMGGSQTKFADLYRLIANNLPDWQRDTKPSDDRIKLIYLVIEKLVSYLDTTITTETKSSLVAKFRDRLLSFVEGERLRNGIKFITNSYRVDFVAEHKEFSIGTLVSLENVTQRAVNTEGKSLLGKGSYGVISSEIEISGEHYADVIAFKLNNLGSHEHYYLAASRDWTRSTVIRNIPVSELKKAPRKIKAPELGSTLFHLGAPSEKVKPESKPTRVGKHYFFLNRGRSNLPEDGFLFEVVAKQKALFRIKVKASIKERIMGKHRNYYVDNFELPISDMSEIPAQRANKFLNSLDYLPSPVPEGYSLGGYSLITHSTGQVRFKMKRNMLPKVGDSRDYGGNISLVKPLYQQFGKLISHVIAGGRDQDKLETLLDLYSGLIPSDGSFVDSNVISRKFNYCVEHLPYSAKQALFRLATKCSCCGANTPKRHVTLTYNKEKACRKCLTTYYMFSTPINQYIRKNDAVSVFDSFSGVISGDLNSSNIYPIGHEKLDGLAVVDGKAFPSTMYDEYLSWTNYTPSRSVTGYHGSRKRFVERVSDSHYPALGVELEVFAKEGISSNLIERLNESLSIDTYYERDSSLSSDNAFEIITQPFGKNEWEERAEKLTEVCKEYKVYGYTTPRAGTYGIHISISRNKLTPLQEARMAMFLCSIGNKNFIRAVAQRYNSYNSNDHNAIGTSRGYEAGNLGYFGNVNGKRKLMSNSKFVPINFRSETAEIRIFQSTTYLPSFLKNLEFVWSLIEWTSISSSTGRGWDHLDFVEWLAARGGAEKDYPNLMSYLRKPKYIVKGSSSSIANSWLEKLRPATRKSLPIPPDEEIIAA